jgi:ferredoxin-NADP reductase
VAVHLICDPVYYLSTVATHGKSVLLMRVNWTFFLFAHVFVPEPAPVPDPLNFFKMPSRISEFHDGEVAMHQTLKVPQRENPTASGLPTSYVWRVMESALLAVGTLDDQGRPWTTLWGGQRGFGGAVSQDVLGFNTAVDAEYDPVLEAFWEGTDRQGSDVVQPNQGQGKEMSALAFDLQTRDRVKLAGKMVAGARTGTGRVQVAMHVTESLGNCPKYINKKDIVPQMPEPELVSDSLPLPPAALELIERADMFFLSSTNGITMDTNIRGGARGFVRVIKNTEDGVELIYPEFSGNRLYQSLGNLKVDPRIGIVIPDIERSDALYLTGSASILVGEEASSILARSKLALKIKVTAARFVKRSLPFRGTFQDDSPYTPPVRHLLTEQDQHIASGEVSRTVEASLTGREAITPHISRFTFKLSSTQGPVPAWQAGQYITLDFGDELDAGYSHMRDDDPQSINDDYIRTFTISSPPGASGSEIEITAKRNGPATNFMMRRNMAVPLELPVLGFGGEESFRIPTTLSRAVFIAGGVGITPLLAQAGAVLASRGNNDAHQLRVLWSLRAEDVPLALDSFKRIEGLAEVTTLFISGDATQKTAVEALERVRSEGRRVETRRIKGDDMEELKGKENKFYLCMGSALLKQMNEWLAGEKIVVESFAY